MRLMPHGFLREVGVRLFTACGSPPEEADILAAELVESSLMGFDSHGVIRYAEYVDSARSGAVHPGAPVAIVRETPSTAVVDCGMNFGIVSATRMVQIVAAKAKETTIACVVSQRCHHVGRLGTWVQKLSARGMFGFAAANSGRHGHMVLPWGGREGRLSTNPLAWSVPTSGDPITHDMSTSMIAEGKVRHLLQSGGEVPAGSILDAAGNPTTDPRALYGPPHGTILPFGSPSLGYKGFGLALLVEILGSTLAGVAIPKEGEPSGYGNGLFLLAIDPGPLCGADVFRGLIDDLSAYIRSSPPQPGREGVIMPGELDLRTRSQRLAAGIPVPDETWALIRGAADHVHARLPDPGGPLMLIDAHLHAFPRVHGRIAAGPTRSLGYGEISAGGTTIRLLPPHSRQTVHTLEMLLRHMSLAGVDKAVMLQGSFYGECNGYALRAVKAHPRTLAAAAYFDPWDAPPGMAGRSRRLIRALREGFTALKMECSVDTGLLGLHPQARLDDPSLDVLWETLEEAGRVLTLDLGAIGSASYQTAAVRAIAASHPRLSIVICHLGQPSPRMESDASLRRLWEEQVSLGLRPNVWMDTAALPAYVQPEKYPFPSAERWLRRAVEIIGAGKLMWGSDIPGLLLHATYAQLAELAQEHTAFLKSAEREQVLGKNAERVYFAAGGAP